jgi:hypothetical protein
MSTRSVGDRSHLRGMIHRHQVVLEFGHHSEQSVHQRGSTILVMAVM